jgi:hypothetical protein
MKGDNVEGFDGHSMFKGEAGSREDSEDKASDEESDGHSMSDDEADSGKDGEYEDCDEGISENSSDGDDDFEHERDEKRLEGQRTRFTAMQLRSMVSLQLTLWMCH